MDALVPLSAAAAAFGAAIIAGVFFTFSNFVMPALRRVPPTQGIAAMQSINITVINPLFLGVFLGSGVISVGLLVAVVRAWGEPSSVYYLCGAVAYVIGTVLVTIARNVPLNDQLADASAEDPGSTELWDRYLRDWTFWNTVRTIASAVAAVAFTLGLMQ